MVADEAWERLQARKEISIGVSLRGAALGRDLIKRFQTATCLKYVKLGSRYLTLTFEIYSMFAGLLGGATPTLVKAQQK